MKQKLETISQLKPMVFEKEITLRDIFKDFLVSKNKDLALFDKYAKIVSFSIDGAIPIEGTRFLSIAETLDIVVKPTQEVKILPNLAGG